MLIEFGQHRRERLPPVFRGNQHLVQQFTEPMRVCELASGAVILRAKSSSQFGRFAMRNQIRVCCPQNQRTQRRNSIVRRTTARPRSSIVEVEHQVAADEIECGTQPSNFHDDAVCNQRWATGGAPRSRSRVWLVFRHY
jgi:hypothetical protein